MTIMVTGGAGFIGANFVLSWLREVGTPVVNLDKLTYAGNLLNLSAARGDDRHHFVHGDIGDGDLVAELLRAHRPRAIVNLAAETHVDRSIHGPEDFIDTNVLGTFRLLEAARGYWSSLPAAEQETFRFLHVSTDEVYGSLEPGEAPFSEARAYTPNSPYAASKAASDHMVRAYHRTYGLPTLTTNCSNNYGPFQFPEKLIPLMLLNATRGEPLPVYGDGLNVRDWLYVADHCDAIRCVLARGAPGETYNVGGGSELNNLELVRKLCALLDELHPESPVRPHAELISFVPDRPGHDRRYAIDSGKIERELDWRPAESFESGIRKTIQWYLGNADWLRDVSSGQYRHWISLNYGRRVSST